MADWNLSRSVAEPGTRTLLGEFIDRDSHIPVDHPAVVHASAVAEFLAVLGNTWTLEHLAAITGQLDARGLGCLSDGYRRAQIALDEAARLDRVMIASLTLANPDVEGVMALAQERWPLSRRRPVSLDVVIASWLAQRVAPVQQLLEALPREVGTSGRPLLRGIAMRTMEPEFLRAPEWADLCAAADVIADRFHSLVTKLFAAIGAEYRALRLYRDDLTSPSASAVLKNLRNGYPFQHSDPLTGVVDGLRHGVVVRVNRPAAHFRHARPGHSDWDGLFEYVAIRVEHR